MLYLFFVFVLHGDHRDLHVLTHSFPTRRSSDLSFRSLSRSPASSPSRRFRWHSSLTSSRPRSGYRAAIRAPTRRWSRQRWPSRSSSRSSASPTCSTCNRHHLPTADTRSRSPSRRSEEHTSELQSLMRISYAVFCLKKKNNIPYHTRKIK